MASTYLTRTPSSAGNRKTWTYSAWIKLGSTATMQLFSAGVDSSNYNSLRITQTGLRATNYNSSDTWNIRTNALLRDTNAWYHIVLRVDTTQSTSSDRVRLYINGELQTSLLESSYPAQNQDEYVNNTNLHAIGTTVPVNSNNFNGSMSHIHLCDGYSYGADSFGSTDSVTGEWQINTSPSVSYGTNGFFILKDGNSVTDSSSNSNAFTVASGTLTKTQDNPSNIFCTINPLSNKIAFNLANGNTTLNDNGSDDNDNGIAGTLGANSGKYYWEMKKGGSGGVMAVITDDVDVRLGNRAVGNGADPNLWGFQSNGTGSSLVSYIAGTFSSSNALQGWGANDIVGYALDMDNGKLYVSINGVFKGLDNNTSDPANGTNPCVTGIPTGGKFILPYFEKRSGDSPETICNFGNGYFGTTAVSSNSGNGYSASGNLGIFQYQPPSGYTALCTKGLNQ